MKINHDAVDGRFELCSSTEIVFDMNGESRDNKIKTWIVLRIFYIFQIQNFMLKCSEISMLFRKYAKMVVATIPFVNSPL